MQGQARRRAHPRPGILRACCSSKNLPLLKRQRERLSPEEQQWGAEIVLQFQMTNASVSDTVVSVGRSARPADHISSDIETRPMRVALDSMRWAKWQQQAWFPRPPSIQAPLPATRKRSQFSWRRPRAEARSRELRRGSLIPVPRFNVPSRHDVILSGLIGSVTSLAVPAIAAPQTLDIPTFESDRYQFTIVRPQ